jgi:hypothetical protein
MRTLMRVAVGMALIVLLGACPSPPSNDSGPTQMDSTEPDAVDAPDGEPERPEEIPGIDSSQCHDPRFQNIPNHVHVGDLVIVLRPVDMTLGWTPVVVPHSGVATARRN